jgi:hypothetical protein
MNKLLLAAAAACVGAGMWLTAAPAQAAPCSGGATPECIACNNQYGGTPAYYPNCVGLPGPPGNQDILGCAGARLRGQPC